ncbi:hypothetical protein KEM54_005131 [Ascosphaera aggregata]|nr:hypothetical protein KEM54_005131 [Ascosphaera aggregata]
MGPPGCRLQLYYGPTSHFSLVQHIYRCLNSDSADGSQNDGDVQEAGAGLDWVSLSGIFFGTTTDNAAQELSGMRLSSLLGSTTPFSSLTAIRDPPVLFVSQKLANLFMDNFIASIYVLCPSGTEQKYRHDLQVLYQSGRAGPQTNLDIFDYHHLLMALALGALASQHYHWGDILYERAKASASGTATRKAVAAGLHKAPQRESAIRANESFEAQNDTLWCLYFYETKLTVLTKEFRYHAFFLGSASATLIYDFISDRESAVENLPFVHAALHILSKMRHGDPIKCSMKALQTILKAIDPGYEWNASSPAPCLNTLTAIDHSLDRTVTSSEPSRSNAQKAEHMQINAQRLPTWSPSDGKWETSSRPQPTRPRSTPLQPQRIPDFLINPPQPPRVSMDATPYPAAAAAANPYIRAMAGPALTGDYMPVTGGSLPDFSASDLGWDFATMDLEAFFSVYPTETG